MGRQEEGLTRRGSSGTGIPPADMVALMVRMLHEAFEGPPGPWSYFTDLTPGTGVFATIAGLHAAEVSQGGGPGGSTIAGHVQHLSATLTRSTNALHGETTAHDRSRTWTVSVVDEQAWVHLRAGLRRAYDTFCVAVETQATWDEEPLGVVFGAIAHAAYHLGAIRQRVPRPGPAQTHPSPP